MLRYIEKENKKLGFKYKDYYLPQGDSFTFTATEQGTAPIEGQPTIERVVFKLGLKHGECDINSVYEQDYLNNDDGTIWFCKVSGEVTKSWKTTCQCDDEPYVYEIEVIYSDGEPVTLTSGGFTIEPQIIGGE